MIPRPLFAIVAALPLSACISFGQEPPATLISLRAESPLAAGTARTVRDGEALVVLVPTVPQELAGQRVPVQAGPTSIAYLKDAQWVDVPNRLFRELVAETIASRTSRVVLDARQASLGGGQRLGGRLVAFGLDSPSRSVVVTYDATLDRGDKAPVATRRFEARVPVSAETTAGVAPALNQAANRVATDVAAWIGG